MPAASPRQRRVAEHVMVEDDTPSRLPLRWLAEHPRDAFAVAAASCAVLAIAINALFLQTVRHPAPLFATSTVRLNAAEEVMPPVKSRALPPAPQPQPQAQPQPRPAGAERAASTATRGADPLADLITADRRIIAVQRALSEFGYGQIEADGILGPATRAAIERFEREQNMPVTGQMSDRLVRDLSAITGRPIR